MKDKYNNMLYCDFIIEIISAKHNYNFEKSYSKHVANKPKILIINFLNTVYTKIVKFSFN